MISGSLTQCLPVSWQETTLWVHRVVLTGSSPCGSTPVSGTSIVTLATRTHDTDRTVSSRGGNGSGVTYDVSWTKNLRDLRLVFGVSTDKFIRITTSVPVYERGIDVPSYASLSTKEGILPSRSRVLYSLSVGDLSLQSF